MRDPLRRVADPERWPVEFEEHLTAEHAKKLFAKIDAKKASRYERTPPDDAPATPTAPTPRISTGTTSFAVADADGNMIAVTQTLSTWGGTFYVSKGLGFLYNNHLRSNRTDRRRLRQPRAADAIDAPPRVPTLVFEKKASGEEVPKLAVGCAGNAWIPLSVYNIITGVIDGKLGAQAAIEAPRFLPGRDPADPLENGERIEIEDRFPRALLQNLIDRGHKLPEDRPQGRGALRLRRGDHRRRGRASKVEGGAEPRRAHAAVPFDRGSRRPHNNVEAIFNSPESHEPHRSRKESPRILAARSGRQDALARRLRRPARRPLLLSEGRHARLHQGIVRVPGQPAEVQEEQGRGARHERARLREQGEVRGQVRPRRSRSSPTKITR